MEFLTAPENARLIDQSVALLVLVAARIVPIVQLAPFLGGSAVPQTIKLGLAMALCIIVYPALWSTGLAGTLPTSGVALAALIAKEVLIGVTLGFVTSLIFETMRVAGQVIDNARGQTMATSMVPQLPERASVSATLLYQLAVVIFLFAGGHHIFVRTLGRSFLAIGPAEFPTLFTASDSIGLLIVRYWADSITFGILVAFPVMGSILLADLFLGLVNKAAPQINVFFLGMPLKAVLGVFVVLAGLDLTFTLFVDHSVLGLELVESLVGLLRVAR
jgi:flagellar biosynthetic protein FliR